MARMPGRYETRGCTARCREGKYKTRHDIPVDCSCGGSSTRKQRFKEKRQVQREVAAALASRMSR